MTFLAPAMLWSLVALLPLVAVYFLKVRPRRKPTTAFFLWEKIFQQKRASSLFQRLRNLWSLLLMALATAAVCLALGRPEWADERQDLLILIDKSASMGANEGRSTRLDLAKRMAADVVEGLNGNQRAAVATVGRRLTFLSHLTENPRELLDAVERVNLSDDTLDWDALITVGNRTDAWQRDHRIVLISDGSFAERELPTHIELLKIGTPRENVGLVAADMAYLPGGNNRLAFYYQIASTFDGEQKIDLTVARIDRSGGERLMKVIPLTVTSGVQAPEVFTLNDAPPGRWIARLEVDDALDSDNIAHLVAIRPPPIRVAVDASDPFFFENSVVAFSEGNDLLTLAGRRSTSTIPRESNAGEGEEDTGVADVTLSKGTAPDVRRAIVFQPEGDGLWWSDIGEEVETGAPRVIAEGHPALRHLDPAAISFVGARQLVPIEGAQVLVADENDLPLIYKATRGERSVVVVNIDPLAADFYFSAWFPVLVHSAATHLVGRESPLAASYRPGEAIPIPGAVEESISQFRRDDWRSTGTQPSGPNTKSTEVRGKWCSEADRIGFYEIENASGNWPVGVSLLAAAETLLSGAVAESTEKPLSRGRAPAHLLTVLAIVVLAAESLLYHRRKVG